MLKYLYEVYNSLKGLKKKVGAKQLGSWGETTRVCVCVGGGGEMSRHQIWGEMTRGETTRGEPVLGRNDLLPV